MGDQLGLGYAHPPHPELDDQIRCTVVELTSCALAMVRQLQWVSPGGVSWSVASTIASTFAAGIDGSRPRPLAPHQTSLALNPRKQKEVHLEEEAQGALGSGSQAVLPGSVPHGPVRSEVRAGPDHASATWHSEEASSKVGGHSSPE